MKIINGTLVTNKVRKYLYPVIIHYGDRFVNIMNAFQKAGIGIGDLILERSGQNYDRHLFILVNVELTFLKGYDFYDMLSVIKEHPSYEKDYRYDMKGVYHMIVICIPDKYLSSFEAFKKSSYSKMFDEKEIEILFRNSTESVKSILAKDNGYKEEFSKLIAKEFHMKEEDIHPDALTGELDFKVQEHEEKFNFYLVGE